MADGKGRIDELAGLMKEFGLAEASWEADGLRVGFKKRSTPVVPVTAMPGVEGLAAVHDGLDHESEHELPPVEEKPQGSPITSPMNGIFYAAPSPNASPFVKEGDSVTAGQVVGLIEAMKVFNEITSNFSGVVRMVSAEPGQIVQPGDVLMYIG